MKYIFCLTLFSCAFTFKEANDNSSMFLYFPKSKTSLETEGYKMDIPNLYWKRVADTLENIHIGNLDSGQFS